MTDADSRCIGLVPLEPPAGTLPDITDAPTTGARRTRSALVIRETWRRDNGAGQVAGRVAQPGVPSCRRGEIGKRICSSSRDSPRTDPGSNPGAGTI